MREYIITEHPDFPYEEPKPKELVRCRDCRYKYCPDTLGMYGIPDDILWCFEVDTDSDDYCSLGVRKWD